MVATPCPPPDPASRSRSPRKKATHYNLFSKHASLPEGKRCQGGLGARTELLPAGTAIQYFLEVDVKQAVGGSMPRRVPLLTAGPQTRVSHSWVDGIVSKDWNPQFFDTKDDSTWPVIHPRAESVTNLNPVYAEKVREAETLTLPPCRIRLPSADVPALSLLFVRWGGEHWVNPGCEGDGGWGQYGCPPSDAYINELISAGIAGHEVLGGTSGCEGNYEIYSLLIRHSRDLLDAVSLAPWLAQSMRGRRKASFWHLWPTDWEDVMHRDYAAYVERRAMFTCMKAFEAQGVRTAFPHPSDLYELITSKSWLCSLALHPQAHLPAATNVSKSALLSQGSLETAKQALKALEHIRKRNPFPLAHEGERPAPSNVNKDGVRKGVVKLGWSWEGRFVLSFDRAEELSERLTEIMVQPSCLVSSCIVQEWVDFDFEMRLYFLPTDEWEPGCRLKPTQIECNCWGGFSDEGRPHTFRKLDPHECLRWWDKDYEAWNDAKRQAVELGNFWLEWLLSMDSQPVPMIRMDFMVSRTGPGRARVIFGELCELGACCLAWNQGPPTIWRHALNAALK
mmetsp:Transcript_86980/g.182039  ORF Transcript_86980/g.182039 Transcript_86980/m.182039 type:complete len:565 (+) Transcript_86980:171-1865(+)|eukprot:CAMPEP_0206484208 /NCGR_PEP_ID=MMETSP0324_2-20121206/39851_1 /ASSEMBLY_ACC=CAM_ASM_000836 /TAXON_ID=2866 /ORGANISM="Crypthecodinium cohnii, Strain Seligo" /LENGTH=564 /DNA_ID=CAMNT_0053962339 /DNA_START=88 /DNA_END=1782 /DNA_ORIENTATION=-